MLELSAEEKHSGAPAAVLVKGDAVSEGPESKDTFVAGEEMTVLFLLAAGVRESADSRASVRFVPCSFELPATNMVDATIGAPEGFESHSCDGDREAALLWSQVRSSRSTRNAESNSLIWR